MRTPVRLSCSAALALATVCANGPGWAQNSCTHLQNLTNPRVPPCVEQVEEALKAKNLTYTRDGATFFLWSNDRRVVALRCVAAIEGAVALTAFAQYQGAPAGEACKMVLDIQTILPVRRQSGG